MTKPKCYQLVGVPGSGKTTWANNQDWALHCVYVSTDQYVEAYARSVDKSYSEIFNPASFPSSSFYLPTPIINSELIGCKY